MYFLYSLSSNLKYFAHLRNFSDIMVFELGSELFCSDIMVFELGPAWAILQ